ncbi:MAG TPA: 16S rRNA (uracil(1498)-N(3))-methyltransferase [Candidatus Binatia bacterium]|nr:16S rRNA (uracil(1498)-N(3))-methyltransferase [Candidatus Binatia bacterium]
MLRLFVPRAHVEGARVRITGAELRHLRTLRLGPGERLAVFDEQGDEHDVRLERIGGHAAEALIVATRRPARESALDLTLAPALLKGTKMDLVVEKATELGVRRIVPLLSRWAVPQPHPQPGRHRTDRWRRIALAAAKQSGRTAVPLVEEPVALEAFVGRPATGLRLLAWEGEHEVPLAALPAHADAVVVAVGPEGGFTEAEVAAARVAGFATVTLAPRVLRAETAAIVAAALCLHRWGDLSTTGRVS